MGGIIESGKSIKQTIHSFAEVWQKHYVREFSARGGDFTQKAKSYIDRRISGSRDRGHRIQLHSIRNGLGFNYVTIARHQLGWWNSFFRVLPTLLNCTG